MLQAFPSHQCGGTSLAQRGRQLIRPQSCRRSGILLHHPIQRWGSRLCELPLRSVDEQVSLLPMDQATRLSMTFALTGTSLEAHLTELRRDVFTKAGTTPISELPKLKHGQHVKIGGLIMARQHPPTAKGFAFLAIEDPGGVVNVVIAPDVYAHDRSALQGAFVLMDGVLQKDHGAINVIARQMTTL
jgi:DNA polymerase III alpha subunit